MRLSNRPSVTVLVLAVACQVAEPGADASEPVPLAFGLRSYVTPEQARQVMPQGLSWAVTERRHAARGRCSRFDEKNVTVMGFVAQGHRGELRLDFINDRLFKVLFFPETPAEYFDYLRSHGPVFRNLQVAFPSPGASLHIWSLPGSRAFAAWADMKLDEQVAAWVLRCT